MLTSTAVWVVCPGLFRLPMVEGGGRGSILPLTQSVEYPSIQQRGQLTPRSSSRTNLMDQATVLPTTVSPWDSQTLAMARRTATDRMKARGQGKLWKQHHRSFSGYWSSALW